MKTLKIRLVLLPLTSFILSTIVCISQIKSTEFGVSQEVTKIENTGHQVQVWQVLPEFTKKAHYNLSIKHAGAGPKASFYIVAWANTNKDGKPEKEIGRSDLMKAQKAGEWSSWEFDSNYDQIFVGNTWGQDDDQIYYQNRRQA